MDSTVPNIRLVRCPKCLQLIPEFGNILMYKCGGCDTILRAKYYIATLENGTSGISEDNSKNISNSIASNDLISSANRMFAIPSEMDTVAEQGGFTSSSPDSISATNPGEKGGNTACCKHGIEMSVSCHDSLVTDSPAFEKDLNLNEDAEKLLKLSPQDQDELRPKAVTEEPTGPINHNFVSEEDVSDIFSAVLPTSSLESTNRSSHAYDASASSSTGHICRNYPLLSKRTFRQKRASFATDGKGKKVREDEFRNDVVTADSGLQIQLQNLGSSATVSSSELSSRHGIQTPERENSFRSEDFHSVRTWMETNSIIDEYTSDERNDRPSTSFGFVEPNHMKILTKVDELRSELIELFDQGKRRYHFRDTRKEDAAQCPGSDFVPSGPSEYPQSRNVQEPLPLHRHFSCLYCQSVDHWSNSLQIGSRLATDDHNIESENLIKQKRRATKRYCLPVSGGSPFIICHNCLRLLQLPADFLVSRKTLQKLQCGSCKEILVYYSGGRHELVPKTSAELQHPLSEVNSNLDATIRHEMPASHSTYQPQRDPNSFLDEYELTFARRENINPECILNASRNSSVMSESQNGEQMKVLQLHRLLGYSSARELLFQYNVDGYQSTEPDTPHSHETARENYIRYGVAGPGVRGPHHENTIAEASSDFRGICREDKLTKQSRIKRGGYPLRRLLKKGIWELNQGLKNVKLKFNSNDRII